jgi:hypothetical protein
VARLDRDSTGRRPLVSLRIEDRSPASGYVPWRAVNYVLDPGDHYAAQSAAFEDVGPDKAAIQAEFAYDRHEGVPVLRSQRTTTITPGGVHGTSELRVVDRHFGPIPEEEFDPDRFLEGPRVTAVQPNPYADDPTLLARFYWLPFPIGALGLIGGAAMSLGRRLQLGS